MKKTVIISTILVILLAVGGYAWLDGFRSEQIHEITHDRRVVYGTPYQGKYGDLKLREIVVKTQQLLEENPSAGHLVVVNYDSSATSENINQLIGIIAPDSSSEILQGLSPDTLLSGNYIRVRMYGHPVVRPTPTQVAQQAREYAQQRQLRLGEEVIEHYFSGDSMWIEHPIENPSMGRQ
ncbi:MAG: hypothetical protein AAF944_00535 [Bacteroidota bacterium]